MDTNAPISVEQYAALKEPAGDRKVLQHLQAGACAVWLTYPNARVAYRYVPGRLEPEVRSAPAGGKFEEPQILPGLSFPLAVILN